jgi:UDP-glucose 4-epimerase
LRVLVTGGAGFIGSSVVYVLLGGGHEVGVIDDLSTGKVANLHPAAWFRRLDILDPVLASHVEAFGPDAIVHLAAQASVSASIADPERDWAVNAEGTRRVAAVAAGVGARRVLSASSAAVYGDPETVPLAETATTVPTSPYGRSKLQAEHELAQELQGSAVDFASLRFANVYGPRQDAAGEGGVVAKFMGAIATGQEPVIFGDGRQTRDFIYVSDVATAIATALESHAVLHSAGGERIGDQAAGVQAEQVHAPGGAPAVAAPSIAAYNISTGIETSVNGLTDHLRGVTRYLGVFAHAPGREGDIFRSALDPSKAAEVFGWGASVTLERGLSTTWRWFAAESAGHESSESIVGDVEGNG